MNFITLKRGIFLLDNGPGDAKQFPRSWNNVYGHS